MYNRPRIIPCLSIINRDLVKTTKFDNPRYIGDPINAVKIFNNKYVDELCILNINATKNDIELDYDYLNQIANEAFMPLSYGGGINNLKQIEKIFHIGYEKVVINTKFVQNPNLISEASKFAGSQSIVVSIDYKSDIFGNSYCYIRSGSVKIKEHPVTLAKKAECLGAGEILLNSISNDGIMNGYDIKMIKQVSNSVNIPVVAYGGAGSVDDISEAINEGGAHAAAASSIFIYYGKKKAVLITVPNEKDYYEKGIYHNND